MTTPEIIKQVIEESNHTSLVKTLANKYIDGLEEMIW